MRPVSFSIFTMPDLDLTKAKGVLVDITRCVGCDSCVIACKLYNNTKWVGNRNPYPAPASGEDALLADENWTVVKKRRVCTQTGGAVNRMEHPVPRTDGSEDWRYVKWQCLHCIKPACVSSCFATSFRQTEKGAVVYYPLTCAGCRYCMLACPFSIPKFEWDNPLPMLTKCSMCNSRIENGDAPACVSVCPTNVMKYGDYEDVLREAKAILAKDRAFLRTIYSDAEVDTILARDYVQHIYGEREAGGTLWMYISDKPFESLGFRMTVPKREIPKYSERYMTYAMPVLGCIAVVFGCVYFVTNVLLGKKEEKAVDNANS